MRHHSVDRGNFGFLHENRTVLNLNVTKHTCQPVLQGENEIQCAEFLCLTSLSVSEKADLIMNGKLDKIYREVVMALWGTVTSLNCSTAWGKGGSKIQ